MKLENRALTSLSALFFSLSCQPIPAGPSYVPPSSEPVCGDQDREAGEACDGQDLAATTCLDLGLGAGLLGCKPNCKDFDRSGCGAPESCGDSSIQSPEICDGVALSGESCEGLGYGPGILTCLFNCADYDTSLCGPPPSCNDGRRSGIEACDGGDFGGLDCAALGFSAGALRCAADCLSIDQSGCNNDCVPTSCEQQGANCGQLPDGCGGTLSCGTCVEPFSCGGGGVANICGEQSCTPTTSCEAAGRVCGGLANGCGQTLNCGTCSEGICDSSGHCVVECQPDCSQQECGLDPVCGVDCGPCGGDQRCVGGQCQAPDTHCDGYSTAGRLSGCGESVSCSDSLECVGGGFIFAPFCADTTPCGTEPTARCCGAGEFCGSTTFGLGGAFCCVPGEMLPGAAPYPDSCADAGLEIGCESAADCPAVWGRGICATWRDTPVCVECQSRTDCSGSTPACDPTTNTCVACTTDAHCTDSAAPACDSDSNTCVRCTGNQHCGGSTPYCDTAINSCETCTEHSHCLSPDAPFCVSGVCEECRDYDDCGSDRPYCNSNQCEECPVVLIFTSSCLNMVSGRHACYPDYTPTADECEIDVDCAEGRICDRPADGYLTCMVSCP